MTTFKNFLDTDALSYCYSLYQLADEGTDRHPDIKLSRPTDRFDIQSPISISLRFRCYKHPLGERNNYTLYNILREYKKGSDVCK